MKNELVVCELDKIDLEAMQEAAAIANFNKNYRLNTGLQTKNQVKRQGILRGSLGAKERQGMVSTRKLFGR